MAQSRLPAFSCAAVALLCQTEEEGRQDHHYSLLIIHTVISLKTFPSDCPESSQISQTLVPDPEVEYKNKQMAVLFIVLWNYIIKKGIILN